MERVTTEGEASPDPWLGATIGERYRVSSLIGRGSTGAVYAAVQEPLGRQVAIKVLDLGEPEPSRQERAHARFLREASLLGRLNHPNTVRVYDYGTEGDHPWLAMELCPWPSLAKVMGDVPMDPLRLVRIVLQVCGSLQEAHDLGMIHRDLKPANILVGTEEDGSDQAKVVDFGLIKPIEGNAEQLTAKGLLVGTPMFMSPEQVRGDADVDQRSDLYALGVLLYRGLTGHYPYDHRSTASVLLAHIKETPRPFPTSIVLPRSLQRIVDALLEKDRDRRPHSVAALARNLQVAESVLTGEITDDIALRALDERLPAARTAERSQEGPVRAAPRAPGGRLLLVVLAVLGAGGVIALAGGFAAMRLFVWFVRG